jgi:alpha-galactosidase
MKSLLPVLLFLKTALLFGQTVQITEAKFKTGDNITWNQPGFDDSKWVTLQTNRTWDEQGYKDYNGFAWYRMHVKISSSLKEQAVWKDSLRINLAKIDDADEVYLNGIQIGKKGSFPNQPSGYITAWDEEREYHLSTRNPAIKWDADNVIAIKVYDGNGLGGIFGGTPYINMMELIDGIKIYFRPGEVNISNKLSTPIVVSNIINQPVTGTLKIKVTDSDADKVIYSKDKIVTITPDKNLVADLGLPINKRLDIVVDFIEKISGKTVGNKKITFYILTPPASASPKINGAKIFGVRPGSPFLFKIAATGEKHLDYSVENLPAGLTVDANTGIITGSLPKAGDYKMNFVVKNSSGEAKREFTVRCGTLLALTPPMGWNSWNCWGLSVSDEKLKSSAQAMIDKGLVDHGWTYMNIDDGWEAEKRNVKNEIIANAKFPDMKALGNWLHEKGLKFGIYSSPGPKTCGGYLGSYKFEKQDAAMYANWGIDYLKYDWCSYGDLKEGKDTALAAFQKPYKLMQAALRSQKRDIVYSLCQYGMKDVWKWGAVVDGNCWRTTGDITDNWKSLSNIGFNQTVQYPYAQPGRWNDPDMLIVGQVGWGENLHPTKLNPDEQYTHISLWCLLSAPLLLGCDISKLDDFTLNLLTNDEVLAVDQDPLGKQARQVTANIDYQVWAKELEDGSKAIGIFNLTDDHMKITINWDELGLSNKCTVRDLWRQKELGSFKESFATKVVPHGVVLLKVTN